jgi:phosphoribosylcarboxyaminoimidazole (NCAIR) mutase
MGGRAGDGAASIAGNGWGAKLQGIVAASGRLPVP